MVSNQAHHDGCLVGRDEVYGLVAYADVSENPDACIFTVQK
jgi:hypothetical protein